MRIEVNGKQYSFSAWQRLSDPPKTWKFIKVVGTDFASESGLKIADLFKANDNTLRLAFYTPGGFYQIMGKLLDLETHLPLKSLTEEL